MCSVVVDWWLWCKVDSFQRQDSENVELSYGMVFLRHSYDIVEYIFEAINTCSEGVCKTCNTDHESYRLHRDIANCSVLRAVPRG